MAPAPILSAAIRRWAAAAPLALYAALAMPGVQAQELVKLPPPALVTADVLSLSRLVEKVVFVVRWGHTRQEAVLEALKQIIDAEGRGEILYRFTDGRWTFHFFLVALKLDEADKMDRNWAQSWDAMGALCQGDWTPAREALLREEKVLEAFHDRVPEKLLGGLPRSRFRALQLELRELVKRLGITTVYVTHDQLEALTMSDAVAVMKDGRIVQEASPVDIYRRPKELTPAQWTDWCTSQLDHAFTAIVDPSHVACVVVELLEPEVELEFWIGLLPISLTWPLNVRSGMASTDTFAAWPIFTFGMFVSSTSTSAWRCTPRASRLPSSWASSGCLAGQPGANAGRRWP